MTNENSLRKSGANGLSLQQALVQIGEEVGYVHKGATNAHHKYKYASAEAVLTKVRAACRKWGVSVVRSSVELVMCEGQNRIVSITQHYSNGSLDEMGRIEHAVFTGLGEGKDGQDKGTMKANTAAIKYLLTNAFNISWGDDPEASEPTEPKKVTAKKRAPAKKAIEGQADIGEMLANSTSTSDLDAIKPLIIALGKDNPNSTRFREQYTTLRDRHIATEKKEAEQAKARAKRKAAKAEKENS